MTDVPDAVFHADGSRLVPTELARGPWSADAQHGGGPAAVLARAVERADPGPAGFVARLTVELLRPVPLTPLEVTVRTTRPGKKVQWLEASLVADGVEVARAHALRLRTADVGLPQITTQEPLRPGPEDSREFDIAPALGRGIPDLGFWTAMELRRVTGSWTEPGPASVWFRLRVPIVAGEEPSPLQRVAAAADFGNGISAALERGAFLFINADLTIYLHRAPVGPWIGLDAATAVEPTGVGLAASVLHDEHGPVGRSLQGLLVDRLE
jgi:hypothetical protein